MIYISQIKQIFLKEISIYNVYLFKLFIFSIFLDRAVYGILLEAMCHNYSLEKG